MGLFDMFKKKNCDLCGGEIGLLGNRKLEDGNCCKHCAGKLSRWFDERRHSTVEQIRAQLAYRAENQEALKSFRSTRVIGEENKVYIDEKTRRFFVARREDIQAENPDIISFEQVLDCRLDIDESREEIMRETRDKDGNIQKVSYNPKRYVYQYDFDMIIRVEHPFFDDLRFRLNDTTLELENNSNRGLVNFSMPGMDPTRDLAYRNFVSMGEKIVELLTAAPGEEPAAAEEPAAPAGPKFCPSCGAPAQGGKFCEHCGSKLM